MEAYSIHGPSLPPLGLGSGMEGIVCRTSKHREGLAWMDGIVTMHGYGLFLTTSKDCAVPQTIGQPPFPMIIFGRRYLLRHGQDVPDWAALKTGFGSMALSRGVVWPKSRNLTFLNIPERHKPERKCGAATVGRRK